MYIPIWLIVVIIIVGLKELYEYTKYTKRDGDAKEIENLKSKLEDLEERIAKIQSAKRKAPYWEFPYDETDSPYAKAENARKSINRKIEKD